MRHRRSLKIIQFAPLAAAALLLVVWFSTPGTLRGQMLSMAASGVPIENMTVPVDRKTAASDWLEKDVRTRASREWADVQFKDAAAKTSVQAAAHIDEATRSRTATEFMLPEDSSAFAPLREFLRRFPGTAVDAYLVEQPPMPPVVLTGGVLLGSVPASPFAAAWNASEEDPRRRAFDPRTWDGYSANATDSAHYAGWDLPGDNQVYSFTWQTKSGLLYRAYAFAPPTESLGRRVPATVNEGAYYPVLKKVHTNLETTLDQDEDTWGCAGCHTPDPPVSGFPLPEPNPGSKPFATALYAGGPVALEPKVQFTTRPPDDSRRIGKWSALSALGLADTSYVHTPSSIASYTADPFASVVWVLPDLPEGGGQTMLFVATHESDPHGAFTSWRASWLGSAVMAGRLWSALQLPWLLAVACTLLGVSLVASPYAFAADARLTRRDEADLEVARIQRDAHDRVYNRMGALSKRVEGTAAGVAGGAADELSNVARDIRETLSDLQAILSGDTPRSGDLAGNSLLAQLRATTAAQAALHDLSAELSAPEELPSLPARLGWDLQCVLDEAIANAARHGGATALEVRISIGADELRLEVSDDGMGVSASDAVSRESTGIAGMGARLAAWGGAARLEHGATGSTLIATVPFPPRAKGRSAG